MGRTAASAAAAEGFKGGLGGEAVVFALGGGGGDALEGGAGAGGADAAEGLEGILAHLRAGLVFEQGQERANALGQPQPAQGGGSHAAHVAIGVFERGEELGHAVGTAGAAEVVHSGGARWSG